MFSFAKAASAAPLAILALSGHTQPVDPGPPSSQSAIIDLIEQMDPAEFTLPISDETLFFPLEDGGFGEMAKANAPGARDPGMFILDALSGAALVQDYIPGAGPDCDADADEPLIVYYGFYADENASVLAVNQAQRLGAVIATGTAIKYRPGPTFCEDEAYINESAKPAFLHTPMSLFGQSPRNFQAMGASQNGLDVQSMFATSGFSARLGGYVDARILGQSSAMSELGMAGAIGQAAIAEAMANNPDAAEALKQMPGLLPGEDGNGALQLDLSTAPISEIAGHNKAFTYAQVRFVHKGANVTPGPWLEDLQQAIRIEGPVLQSEPAFPNGGALED